MKLKDTVGEEVSLVTTITNVWVVQQTGNFLTR
jgi:hypothetical protein